ncbi:MAG: PIN domain-containing protein [bacterium]
MTTSNLALLDSNILIYRHQALSEFHTRTRALLRKGFKGDLLLGICPQVLNEFYAVITNPRRVTDPISPAEAVREIETYIKAKNIIKVYPKEDIFDVTIHLLKTYKINDRDIFDLQLVATMISNDITCLYPYNQNDFSRFKEIEVLTP